MGYRFCLEITCLKLIDQCRFCLDRNSLVFFIWHQKRNFRSCSCSFCFIIKSHIELVESLRLLGRKASRKNRLRLATTVDSTVAFLFELLLPNKVLSEQHFLVSLIIIVTFLGTDRFFNDFSITFFWKCLSIHFNMIFPLFNL